MSSKVKSKEIATGMQNAALKGTKVPHRISQPVIRKTSDGYVLAAFIFFFSKDNIDNGELPRPEYWMTVDFISGKLISEFRCKDTDFSTQPFDRLYSIKGDINAKVTSNYFTEAFEYLDQVREEYIENGKLKLELYELYLKRVLDTIPSDYIIFYTELSCV